MIKIKRIGSLKSLKASPTVTKLSHDDFLAKKKELGIIKPKQVKPSTPLAGYTDYINSLDWDHFVTFTTGYTMSLKGARRAMERVQKIYNRNTYGDSIIKGGMRMFWVAEPFDVKEGFHTHALVYYYDRELHKMTHMGVSQDFFELKRAWEQTAGSLKGSGGRKWNEQYGCAIETTGSTKARIDIKRYQKEKGAGFYVAKYMMKSRADWELQESNRY